MGVSFFLLVFIPISGALGLNSGELTVWKYLKNDSDDIKFLPGTAERVNLSISISVISLTDYDPNSGTIELACWMRLSWKIPHLSWNPEKFGGVTAIHLPVSKIWVPDIQSYNHKTTTNTVDALVILNHFGDFMWVPQLLSKILCEPAPNSPNFPNDMILCRAKFGSWTRHGFALNLTVPKSAENYLLANYVSKQLQLNGWSLVNASIIYSEFRYPCCEEPYPDVSISLFIQRKYKYYALTTSCPGVITGLIIALLYLLPPSFSARIISQILSLLIATYIGIAEVRLIGRTFTTAPLVNYFVGIMVLDVFAIFWSIIATIAWTYCSQYGHQSTSCFDSLATKLECICCLPSVNTTEDQQNIALDDDNNENREKKAHLTAIQRICLALDRLFCLITIIILLILFVFLAL